MTDRGEVVTKKSAPEHNPDVAYAELDGDRPMREVLADRKRNIATVPRSVRERAFRRRAFLIGSLQSCLCGYPLVERETASRHEEWCPSHALHLSYEAQKSVDAQRNHEPNKDNNDGT